jgi:hypothetical protein
MKRLCLAGSIAVAVALLAGLSAAAATGAAGVAAGSSGAAGQPGTLYVGFAVNRFFVQGKTLFASGTKIATLTTVDGAQHSERKAFVARVSTAKRTTAAAAATTTRSPQTATRICNVLNLNLGPTHLALLGLIVDLDKVVLTITADSAGGLLGGLLCGLAGGSGLLPGGTGALPGGSAAPTPLATTAGRLTRAVKASGLAQGRGFLIPLSVTAAPKPMSAQALPPVPAGVCTFLDLPLGPLDLNLLGLMVHLDATELRITADPAGGLLGSLLCSLAGGVTAPTTPGTTTPTP